MGRRWRISAEVNLWSLPRPYLAFGWEERRMWLGIVLGNHATDNAFALITYCELSQHQFDLLWRFLALLRRVPGQAPAARS